MEVNVQLHGRQLYSQRKTPGTHCSGSWVGPTAGLDTVAKKRIPAPAGNRNPVTVLTVCVLNSSETVTCKGPWCSAMAGAKVCHDIVYIPWKLWTSSVVSVLFATFHIPWHPHYLHRNFYFMGIPFLWSK